MLLKYSMKIVFNPDCAIGLGGNQLGAVPVCFSCPSLVI